MNVKILYTTNCAITIHFCKGHELASAEWGHRCTNLQDAIDMSEYILRYIYPDSATSIAIWEVNDRLPRNSLNSDLTFFLIWCII